VLCTHRSMLKLIQWFAEAYFTHCMHILAGTSRRLRMMPFFRFAYVLCAPGARCAGVDLVPEYIQRR
jgi:hypothetical protein